MGGLAKTWHQHDQIRHFFRTTFLHAWFFFYLLLKIVFFYIFHTRNGNNFASFARTTLAESGKQHFVMSRGEPISYRLRLTSLKPKCFNWRLLKKRSWSVCWTFRENFGRLLLQENWLFYTEVALLLSPHVCVSGFVSCRSRLSCISSDVSERLLLFPVVSLKPPPPKTPSGWSAQGSAASSCEHAHE